MTDGLLLNAAKTGDFLTAKECLEGGGDVEANAGSGSALWWAAYYGHAKVVRILIEYGADLSSAYNGDTPLKAARNRSNKEAMAALAEAVQQPRKSEATEKWVAMGADSVAFVGVYPGLQRKLTHVFNFETRERVLFTENLRKQTEDVAANTSFDALPPRALEKALEEFERLGGTADREYVLQGQSRLGKSRRLPPQEPSNG